MPITHVCPHERKPNNSHGLSGVMECSLAMFFLYSCELLRFQDLEVIYTLAGSDSFIGLIFYFSSYDESINLS